MTKEEAELKFKVFIETKPELKEYLSRSVYNKVWPGNIFDCNRDCPANNHCPNLGGCKLNILAYYRTLETKGDKMTKTQKVEELALAFRDKYIATHTYDKDWHAPDGYARNMCDNCPARKVDGPRTIPGDTYREAHCSTSPCQNNIRKAYTTLIEKGEIKMEKTVDTPEQKKSRKLLLKYILTQTAKMAATIKPKAKSGLIPKVEKLNMLIATFPGSCSDGKRHMSALFTAALGTKVDYTVYKECPEDGVHFVRGLSLVPLNHANSHNYDIGKPMLFKSHLSSNHIRPGNTLGNQFSSNPLHSRFATTAEITKMVNEIDLESTMDSLGIVIL